MRRGVGIDPLHPRLCVCSAARERHGAKKKPYQTKIELQKNGGIYVNVFWSGLGRYRAGTDVRPSIPCSGELGPM